MLATDPPHSTGDVSSFVYDDHDDSYFATIKMFYAVNTSANYTLPRRSVGVSATKVSTRWPQPTLALTADDIDDRAWGADTAAARATNNRTELYGLSAFAYQSQYIGLLWVAHFNNQTVSFNSLSCLDFPRVCSRLPWPSFGSPSVSKQRSDLNLLRTARLTSRSSAPETAAAGDEPTLLRTLACGRSCSRAARWRGTE